MSDNIPVAACKAEILIAEDSATQAMLLESILQEAGYRVTVARDGGKALKTLQTWQPTLVITDIQMPVMDGYQLCHSIKNDPALAHLPVILLTSLSAPQDIIRGLECGADNFVVKPYADAFLLARIESVLTNLALANKDTDRGIHIQFGGERYIITSDRLQILNLLLSTYETAVNTNEVLRKAQEALKEAQAQLIQVEKQQLTGRLAAGVAHEIKNPLAIMEMGVELLAGEVSEGGAAVLSEVREAVRRASAVVKGLLQMSSPEELGMQLLSLNVPLEQALKRREVEFVQGRIAVHKSLSPDLPPSRIALAKIEQAFENILSNAVHAMPKGGTLTVSTFVRTMTAADVAFDAGDRSGVRLRLGDQAAVIEIRDTGGGIDPVHLSKVFDPFFSTRPTGTGMGLGLTVARKFIELHGGQIALANAPDGGAAVTLLFPLR